MLITAIVQRIFSYINKTLCHEKCQPYLSGILSSFSQMQIGYIWQHMIMYNNCGIGYKVQCGGNT